MVESIKDILLFIPNLIGFSRIIFALLSFALTEKPLLFSFLYTLSQLLDALDGYAARHFNQSTVFGGLLDQLTDRCSFLGLLFCLCKVYPNQTFLFSCVAIIDISSHWVHLYASLLLGRTSHKSKQDNYVLNLYYTSKTVLFTLCLGNEAFFLSLFLSAFTQSNYLAWCTKLFAPLAFLKIVVNIVQGFDAFKNIARIDVEKRNKQLND